MGKGLKHFESTVEGKEPAAEEPPPDVRKLLERLMEGDCSATERAKAMDYLDQNSSWLKWFAMRLRDRELP